jgi:predicted nucleic acid-binding protein
MAATAAALFRLVRAGDETFVISDAVVAEVLFILSSKRHYAVPRADAAALLKPLLQLPGCRMPRKGLCLVALDLWTASPNLSFVDALVATYADRLGAPLATFDADLARVPGIVTWAPPASEA